MVPPPIPPPPLFSPNSSFPPRRPPPDPYPLITDAHQAGHPAAATPTDTWALYLNTRFSLRDDLLATLPPAEKELVGKELRRVRYLREYFASHRLFLDGLPIVAALEAERARWRGWAAARCDAELARPGVDARGRVILQRVRAWSHPTGAGEGEGGGMSSPTEMEMEIANDKVDDNPRERDYGYNGWVIEFEKGRGGVDVQFPGCHGRFPHQKIPMQKLLGPGGKGLLRRRTGKEEENTWRYFHLQANCMGWVEEAVSRYYGEEGSEFEGRRRWRGGGYHGGTKGQSNTERLLKRELWHGQERGGAETHMPPHSRQIRPRCAIVPSPPRDTAPERNKKVDEGEVMVDSSHASHVSQDIVLFMPYLHWEVDKRLVRMTNVVRKTRKINDIEFERERAAKRRGTWGSVVERATKQAKAQRLNSSTSGPTVEGGGEEEDSPSWRPKSPLGSYLWLAAKLYQLIDEAADWRLIGDHLCTQSPLHVRRTLEQYSCWTAEDTLHRDRQQVVYRGTKQGSDPEAIPRVVMVDQLWLWILDENTIISAFPRRWGRNKPDPSAVHRAIRDHLGAIDQSQITSIYDLALIIIDECSKVFFDRTKPDLRPEVVDIFSSAISNISEKKMQAYERFGRDVKRMNTQDPLQTAEELLRKSLNIKFEWSVLMEAQNVIDQLQIMQEIFTQQITVMGDFEKALRAMSTEPWRDQEALRSALDRAAALMTEMKLRKTELASLERRQMDSRSQLRELLDMKQQQSNIIEAKAAIRRADETVLQGRSIVVFTVVTIFFLPLSFFATLFGMNAREFNEGTMALGTQLIYMFVLSSVVIVLSLAIAFSSWARDVLFGACRLSYAFLSRPVKRKNPKNRLEDASPKTMREFMLDKLQEWENKDEDAKAIVSGAGLPISVQQSVTRRNGNGQFPDTAISRFWSRRRSD